MKKKLLFVFPLFFLFAVLIFLLGDNREIEKDFLLKGNSFIEGLRIVHKKDGNSIWTVNAKRADIIESEDKAKLTGISMTVEEKGMTIHAGEGLYDMSTRNLSLQGRITADANGYTIIANSAELDNSTGEIKTKGDVKIESKKFNVEGAGMEATSDQKVRILRNVKATFNR